MKNLSSVNKKDLEKIKKIPRNTKTQKKKYIMIYSISKAWNTLLYSEILSHDNNFMHNPEKS